LRRLAFARAARRRHRLGRIEAGILGLRQQTAQREQVIGLRRLRRQILDDRRTVVGVEHRESATQAELVVFDLQQLQSERMKRADHEFVGAGALQQPRRAFAHLACGLVGKRDRRNLARRQVLVAHQVGDLLGDHARLAGSGAGQDEQRTVAVFDGCALLRVEFHSNEAGLSARIVRETKDDEEREPSAVNREPKSIGVCVLPAHGSRFTSLFHSAA
jgi:hypothetical protein